MLSQTNISNNTPYFPSIERSSTLGRVLEVMERCLVSFPTNFPGSMANRDKSLSIANMDETDFNVELEHWLSLEFQGSKLNGLFTIAREYPEQRTPSTKKPIGLRRQIDIAIRLADGTRLLTLEGKRLHDPKDSQYVSGNTGGIARFKRENHAKELPFSCMIAYVQTENFTFWQEKVNYWINKEVQDSHDGFWSVSDSLSIPQVVQANLVVCSSTHQRLTQAPIDLCHYWVWVA